MKTAKRLLAMLLFAFVALTQLMAVQADDILLADQPIVYGDSTFRQRILDRTGGERTPIGLVLSGGSARAFAHIGVIKYLEEQGIVPDFIISNSMGSIVGLMYAAGLSADQIYESINSVSLQTLFDLTIPLEGGMLDSDRFLAKLASILGPDVRLETLSIPIMVVTEDLVTRRQIQLCEGDFYRVMKASYALPVYFKPVPYEGHLLLDGGITNLVPVDLAFEYADSVIISTTFYDVDTLNLKNPLTILNVSIDIGKRRRGVEELKRYLDQAIWVRCAVEDVSFMEFGELEYLTQKGYESAKTQQEKLSKLPVTGQLEKLSDLRIGLGEKLAKSTEQYKLFKQVPLYNSSHLLGLGLDSDYATDDVNALKDDTTLGLRYSLRTGNLAFQANLGYSLQFLTNKQFSAVPAIRTQVDYYLLKHLKASAYAAFLYDIPTLAPMLSFGAILEGRLYLMDDHLRLSLMQSVEQVSNFKDNDHLSAWQDNTFLYTVRLQSLISFQDKPSWNFDDFRIDAAYQILGDYLTSRSFLSTRLETELQQRQVDLYLGFKSFARFALDGQGAVPFFMSDGFRTNNTAIAAQGHDLSVASDGVNQLVGVNLNLGYRPKNFNPTMAELLLFKNSSISIYSDFLWNRATFEPYVSLGLQFQTDISLLGIRTLPLTVYGGWDQSVNSIVWGLWFNVVF